MANLTIRRLDDAIRDELRLRAARNGRSVEDEVRVILREAAAASPAIVPAPMIPATPALDPVGVGKRRVLVIIGGGIAAYKSLDLIRRLRERGCHVRGVLTQAAQHFVTPLSVSAIADDRCATDLFDPQSEFDAGHIRLAREADLIIVAPATADLMAKIVHGLANDLATAILLARRAPLLVAPAMNPAMWANAATQRNAARLKTDGALFVGPNAGEMAEAGEAGLGRMAEPLEIVAVAEKILRPAPVGPMAGKHVLITSGPTHEPIDPVRYIANRSSGKQGYAIAAAAVAAGARVTLISGPVNLPDPPGAHVIRVEAARAMLEAVEANLPADVAIFAAAVADWRVASEGAQKLKKGAAGPPSLALVENPDILATIARRAHDRPTLVIGFAAETERVIDHASAKLARKGCDWIVANDVSMSSDVAGGVMGSDRNTVHIIARDGIESWPQMAKQDVARALIARIAQHLGAPIPSGDT